MIQLFLLYVFADDTTLVYSDKTNAGTENTLNTELHKVSDWLVGNSNFIIFSLGNKKKSLNILINNLPVSEKTVTKYLGTLMDNKLNWKQHIQMILKELAYWQTIRHFAQK